MQILYNKGRICFILFSGGYTWLKKQNSLLRLTIQH
nr:MAG TPA: hypothetical protein [Caudoviricetes sp.]